MPLVVDEKWKAEIARALPELPEARRARMVKDYGITEYDAQVLTFSSRWPINSSRPPRPQPIPSESPTWYRVSYWEG